LSDTYSFQIYSSVQQLPASWDELAARNVFLSSEYLVIAEKSAPLNMTCHFIGIFKESVLVGIAISQFINLRTHSFGERDKHLRTKCTEFCFKNLSSKVLVLGNNMLTGQNGYCFDTQPQRPKD
jgi:hypothetical protein